jgi:hypothetical protein
MTPDGRKGKVFSLRLSDAERELVQQAIAAAVRRQNREAMGDAYDWRELYRWRSMTVGTFLREAAVEKAKRLLEAGTTGGGPAGGSTASSAEKKKRRRR